VQRQKLINFIIQKMSTPNSHYLEIGVLHGSTFNNINTDTRT